MCNELGQLVQGYKNVKSRNTFFFILSNKVQKYKKITYIKIVCVICFQKIEIHRVRLTAGGNLISCEGITSILIAAITTIKAHQNSIISTKNAKYTTLSIKDFYLNSYLGDYEYMKIYISLFYLILQNYITSAIQQMIKILLIWKLEVECIDFLKLEDQLMKNQLLISLPAAIAPLNLHLIYKYISN